MYHQCSNPECAAALVELSQSPLGVLSGAAIRRALRIETQEITFGRAEAVDIVAVDWRKLHECNEVLGWDASTVFMAAFAQTRRGRDRRHTAREGKERRPVGRDIRGQWGGDELIFVVEAGQGMGLLMRLVRALDTLTARLSDTQRARLHTITGGIIDGFAGAFVLVQKSVQPLTDATRAIDLCGTLKAGTVTGNRATSGRAGTIVTSLEAS